MPKLTIRANRYGRIDGRTDESPSILENLRSLKKIIIKQNYCITYQGKEQGWQRLLEAAKQLFEIKRRKKYGKQTKKLRTEWVIEQMFSDHKKQRNGGKFFFLKSRNLIYLIF